MGAAIRVAAAGAGTCAAASPGNANDRRPLPSAETSRGGSEVGLWRPAPRSCRGIPLAGGCACPTRAFLGPNERAPRAGGAPGEYTTRGEGWFPAQDRGLWVLCRLRI